MGAPQYATAADYRTYCGLNENDPIPDNLTLLLTAAALAVREYTMTLFYQTDPNTGLPSDGGLADTFRDATCAQAAAMDALGIDPAMGGASQPNTAASKSISGASITYSSSEQQAAALLRQQVATGLAPAAVRILRAAGMPLNTPWRVG
jgi:hypothetical protein